MSVMAAYIYWLKCMGVYLEDTIMKYLDSAAGTFKRESLSSVECKRRRLPVQYTSFFCSPGIFFLFNWHTIITALSTLLSRLYHAMCLSVTSSFTIWDNCACVFACAHLWDRRNTVRHNVWSICLCVCLWERPHPPLCARHQAVPYNCQISPTFPLFIGPDRH